MTEYKNQSVDQIQKQLSNKFEKTSSGELEMIKKSILLDKQLLMRL